MCYECLASGVLWCGISSFLRAKVDGLIVVWCGMHGSDCSAVVVVVMVVVVVVVVVVGSSCDGDGRW